MDNEELKELSEEVIEVKEEPSEIVEEIKSEESEEKSKRGRKKSRQIKTGFINKEIKRYIDSSEIKTQLGSVIFFEDNEDGTVSHYKDRNGNQLLGILKDSQVREVNFSK